MIAQTAPEGFCTVSLAQRVVQFTGHGYTSGYDGAEGGIFPVDYRAAVRHGSNNEKPVQIVIPRTMLSNWELNTCLVDNLPDKKITLTIFRVILVTWHSYMTAYTLGPEDMTNIRGLHRFARQGDHTSPEENGPGQEYVLGFGNLLGEFKFARYVDFRFDDLLSIRPPREGRFSQLKPDAVV
ncbi:hypothetical protein FRC10_009452 [Ceratobasidium sp. 414]|nr:hypothetical protein FRC10_009452 [Ceratobasidium sp. 414]